MIHEGVGWAARPRHHRSQVPASSHPPVTQSGAKGPPATPLPAGQTGPRATSPPLIGTARRRAQPDPMVTFPHPAADLAQPQGAVSHCHS
jgi:hypothetical protein